MAAAARMGDKDSSNGTIIGSASADVIINGQPAAIVGSVDAPHAPYGRKHPPHHAATIVDGSSTVIVNGKPLARVGSKLSCGHTIAGGSPDVDIG